LTRQADNPSIAASPRRARAIAAVLVFVLTFGQSFIRTSFLNDHFDRITRARQIAVYGERPFADFRDPGHFLALYVSAAALRASDGLLGEAVVANVGIAVATTLTFLMTASATGSLVAGVIAMFAMWVVPARYYDFSKILFYMLGLALCWRYVDRRRPAHLVTAGVVAGLATLFRYDNGILLMASTALAIVLLQWRFLRRTLGHLAIYGAATLVTIAPGAVMIQASVGWREAARQIFQYASGEGQQLSIPPLALDVTSGVYVLIVASVPMALAALWLARRRAAASPLASPLPKIAAVVVLLTGVIVVVLRDPIVARVGIGVPPAALLIAWATGVLSPFRMPALRGRWLAGVAAAVLIVAIVAIQPRRVVRAPFAIWTLLRARVADLKHPTTVHAPRSVQGLTRYLQACTSPDDRVLLTWFAPDVLYYSGRGAAGGMVSFSGDHWSSPADQARTVEQMRGQSVPVVVMESSADDLRRAFPMLVAYLEADYSEAGSSSFDPTDLAGHQYHVLIRRTVREAAMDAETGLPCPATASPAGAAGARRQGAATLKISE
jgi:hypothetical protein